MGRLTKAQDRMLHAVADGEVQRLFDVYGGYWWTERGQRLPAYGKNEHWPPLPIRYLLEMKLIHQCAVERLGSGSQVMKYALTPTGAAAIRSKANG